MRYIKYTSSLSLPSPHSTLGFQTAQVIVLTHSAQQTNHHSMMGSITDPPDGKAVAGSVFASVGVYAVSFAPSFPFILLLLYSPCPFSVLPFLLSFSIHPAHSPFSPSSSPFSPSPCVVSFPSSQSLPPIYTRCSELTYLGGRSSSFSAGSRRICM